ncbi:MFS transporter [Pseudovibrio sp. WM33]|uniref:MFS transporter n=1 Tax=Pseudovibrio sp. WM33 TaxID=1735585 RepID=UPI0007AE3F10|nr:MFS transporter [Pseudovibrio sp. WM33]KZL22410.1 Major Facilitator Superfamily protein [Pseudovibrio sp. WM33]
MKSSVFVFFGSMFGSRLGDQLLLFVVPLVVFQTTGSVSLSGLAFAAETLPRILCFPVCGILADRFSPVTLIRISQAGRSLVCALGLVGQYFMPHVGWIVAIAALSGVLTTQGFMAREVMLPQIFKDVTFTKVQSYAQSVDQICIVLGPVIAAALFNVFGWEIVVVMSGALFVCADALISIWRRLSDVELKEAKPLDGHWTKPFRIALNHLFYLPGLKRIVALTALVNLVFGVTLATSASMVTGLYEQSEEFYALLQSVGAIVTFAVLLVTGASRLKLTHIGIISYSGLVVGGVITGFTSNYWIYLLGYCVILGFDSMFNVYIRSARQKIIPPEDYGKTVGVIILFNNFTLPLSGLFVGFVTSVEYTGWLVLALTAFIACAGLALSLVGDSVQQAKVSETQ